MTTRRSAARVLRESEASRPPPWRRLLQDIILPIVESDPECDEGGPPSDTLQDGVCCRAPAERRRRQGQAGPGRWRSRIGGGGGAQELEAGGRGARTRGRQE